MSDAITYSMTPTVYPGAAGVDAGYTDIAALTPEALLTYCAAQLGSIDQEIDQFMSAQKTMMKKKEILQKLKEDIAGNNTIGKDTAPTEQNKVKIAQGYLEAYNALKEDFPELAEQVNAQFKEWFPKGDLSTGTANTVGNAVPTTSDTEFQEKVSDIQGLIDHLGQNMELNMIQLQSAMSKRQTAIQLTTNILDKYNKGLEQIAANFK